jgi:hypothetical protein
VPSVAIVNKIFASNEVSFFRGFFLFCFPLTLGSVTSPWSGVRNYNNGFVEEEQNPVAVFWKIGDGKHPRYCLALY